MKIVVFDENPDMASKVGSFLNKEFKNVLVSSNLISFFDCLANIEEEESLDLVFVISENVLNERDMKASYVLKQYDICKPFFTYSLNNDMLLTLILNYISRHFLSCKNNDMDCILKIKLSFDKLANTLSLLSNTCKFLENRVVDDYDDGEDEENKKHETILNVGVCSNINLEKDIFSYLNKNQTKLLMCMISNKYGISLEDIALNIWGNDAENKTQNIYTLIHGVKKVLKDKMNGKYEIINSRKRYRLVRVDIEPELFII